MSVKLFCSQMKFETFPTRCLARDQNLPTSGGKIVLLEQTELNYPNMTTTRFLSSSETLGQLVEEDKSLNGREKNLDEEKSRRRERAPGDKVLMDQFPGGRLPYGVDGDARRKF